MQAEFLFLGTGGSAGVPVIGCNCSVCTSSSSYNKRLRTSACIRVQGKSFLIDVGPDFRAQALTHKIDRLDGVLLTHTHYDHIGGIDDLRVYYFLQEGKLPCLLSQETFDEVKVCYHYLMKPLQDGHTICAQIDFFILEKDFGKVNFQGFEWKYVSYHQAEMKVTGYRLGNLAYISDIRTYPETLVSALQGTEILILSALKEAPTQMHFGLEEAVHFSKQVGAKKTYLTHLSHDFDYEKAGKKLPSNFCFAYDGLKLVFQAS